MEIATKHILETEVATAQDKDQAESQTSSTSGFENSMSQPKKKLFGKLLIWNILVFACLLLIGYFVVLNIQNGIYIIDAIVKCWFLILIFFILQIFYFRYAYKSSTKKYISHLMDSKEFMDHLTKMKKNTPHLELSKVLFHYDVIYNSTFSKTVVMQRTPAPNPLHGQTCRATKIVKFTKYFTYKFDETHDNSVLNADEVMTQGLVKVQFEKIVNIGEDSLKAINSLMEERSKENLYSYQDVTVSFDTNVPEFQGKILLVNPEKKWIYGNTAFFYATFFLCGWIYTLFIERSCMRKKFKVEKTVTYSR
jgi:hypothetical protein